VTATEVIVRLLLGAGWVAWLYPFLFRAPHNQKRASITRKGPTTLGLLLESSAIAIAMLTGFLPHDEIEWWRVALMVAFSVPSIISAWSAVKHLGKQFRVNAGLYEDHELVRTGAYAVVRHPIYAGLFGMTLATIAVATPWQWALVSVAMFIAGTEIRVHTEDGLLRGRFGATFDEYRRSVKAYIPWVR
jgi:protein-S-isoprenylcysteine O-methyltransferase Ste14